ncbi:acyl-CoA-binding domain-containing protein 6 isoform X2 [Phoenix dactylifera]|nr:acyl-CoA-binding domain-containing protein 6 isoform X2 [Phoenix dactylifera]
MAFAEAMRLFVKILEEEDPAWYSKAPEYIVEPTTGMEMHKPKLCLTTPNGNSSPKPNTISTEIGDMSETQDKDITMEGLGSVTMYDQWVAPPLSGQRPKPRYQHGSALLQEKMYIFGGNYNGRYLNDLQVLDLKTLTWSKVVAKSTSDSGESTVSMPVAPCSGHSLITWRSRILSVAGHTKNPSATVTVKEFDPQTCMWSNIETQGKAPVSRGGQSATLVGTRLVMFGGENAKRSLLNDLHILDLETMTWNEVDYIGTPPSPRSDHAAACHAERYLLIFGGASHAMCFNDLHVLDLKSMEWSRPKQHGVTPASRAGHAGVTVGENWFIVGGGNNKSGVSETLLLNMSTFTWSVVTTVQGRVPLASEGLSLVFASFTGEDVIISFGGYNGHYSNEVYVLKQSCKSNAQTRIVDGPDSITTSRAVEPEIETAQEGKVREIMMDNVDPLPANVRNVETSEKLVSALKVGNEELRATITREQFEMVHLKQELADAESRNANLTKELQSVRGQLAAEQSRCFKLEVDVAELRQKLQTMDTLQKELELLQRQKAAAEQAALNAERRQGSRGVWGWLAGTPPDKSDS